MNSLQKKLNKKKKKQQGSTSKLRPGDWICAKSKCKAHNYQHRTKCYKCFTPIQSQRTKNRGDWICSNVVCSAINYQKRTECYVCYAPKPPAKNLPGVVVHINKNKNYCFIEQYDEKEKKKNESKRLPRIYARSSIVKDNAFWMLEEGTKVIYSLEESEEGDQLRAESVTMHKYNDGSAIQSNKRVDDWVCSQCNHYQTGGIQCDKCGHANDTRLKEKEPEQKEKQDKKKKEYLKAQVKKYEKEVPDFKHRFEGKGSEWKENAIMRKYNQQNLAMEATARAEILLPSDQGFLEPEGMEKTDKFSQEKLFEFVDMRSQEKMFNLKLTEFGPYTMDYTRNGRHILLAGKKGHIALFNWQTKKLVTEFHVKEAIRDVKFLHNETFYAVAQKKYVYVYDNTGMELHELRTLQNVTALEFLPYHFLLGTVNRYKIQWVDTSTGQPVASHRTKLYDCHVMRANPRNALLFLGNLKGVVSMWSPNVQKPLVKMLCHSAPVTALAIDIHGQHMVTAGVDNKVKVWDIRTYKMINSWVPKHPVTSIDISQTGLLGLGFGSSVKIMKHFSNKKIRSSYMHESLKGCSVERIRFCPYEDVMGVAHSKGFSNLIIPGSGEPNFDTYVANPFENKKQRKEKTVQDLLNKLQPEMISLKPLFDLMTQKEHKYQQEKKVQRKLNEQNFAIEKIKQKTKKRRTGIVSGFKRAEIFKDHEKTMEIKRQMREERSKKRKQQVSDQDYNALSRFEWKSSR